MDGAGFAAVRAGAGERAGTVVDGAAVDAGGRREGVELGGEFGEPGAGGGEFCGGGWADEGFDDEEPGFFEIGDGGWGGGEGGGVRARVPAVS